MITSFSNDRIKFIRTLFDRKGRLESQLFFVEGVRLVAEAVSKKADLELLIVSPNLLRSDFAQELVHQQKDRGVQILEVSEDIFKRLSLKEGPQGLAAICRQKWISLDQILPFEGLGWVALDAIADPGNLGTILRTMDAVGGDGIILLDQSTDPYDPSSVRASMGAVFTQKIARASFLEFAEWKRSSQTSLIGTSGSAQVDYHTYAYPLNFVLLMGSERHGLLEHHIALCDEIVRIPMVGTGSDSLNLAVATAVMLYEVYNHKRDQGIR